MTIQIDSREHKHAITKIKAYFDKNGINYFVSKLPCGDYQDLDNARFCIDRKKDLLELCGNVCQQHKRFTNELKRANELGINLVFLVEHGENIKSLEDVRNWKNPRLKTSPLAVSGERLYKILSMLEKTYDTKFYFCTKAETGKRIIELLKRRDKLNLKMKEKTYEQRLRAYEREKQELLRKGLNFRKYEEEVRRLAVKYNL